MAFDAVVIRFTETKGGSARSRVLSHGWYCGDCTLATVTDWEHAGRSTVRLELEHGAVGVSDDPVLCARCGDSLSDGRGIGDPSPVGIAEIAERLGVRRDTVDQWRTRHLLPEPDWTVGGRPAWRWGHIQLWAVTTGRWPEG